MRRSIIKVPKHLCVLVFFTLIAFGANAQNRTITGTVTSKDGTRLADASVIVVGQKTGVRTAPDGTFSIRVPANAKELQISYVGSETQKVDITSTSSVMVALADAPQSLSDVVVIGYGSVKKKDLTGSVATVTEKDFQQGTIISPEELIAGKVAGVSITSNGGQPGAGSVIRVRGGASLYASNDPLIVVDGVPLSSVNFQGINPDDIASFTVLKDAAATAIYGSRASNGVIMITTKRGRHGKPVISFSTAVSGAQIQKEYPVLSAAQFRNIVNTNPNSSPGEVALLGTANTDWQQQIYQTAITTDNNLSISGSTKNMPYRISGEYLNQNGVLKTDNLQREALSIGLSPLLLKDHLKIDINIHGSSTDSRTAEGENGSGAATAIGDAIGYDPTQPVYSGGKNFGGYKEWLTNDTTPNSLAVRNPVALLNQYNQENHALRAFGNVQFDYKMPFLPDLHANLNLGFDGAKYTGTTVQPADAASAYNAIPDLRGQNNQYYNNYTNKTGEFYLSYIKDLKSIKSNINAVAGYGYYDDYTYAKNYYSFSATNDTSPTYTPTYPSSFTETTLESYYGRLIYEYDNKFTLMGSIRTDGSSRFAPSYRWGTFPSASFTWRISQEGSLKNSTVLSDLKLRLSYGVTGNQNLGSTPQGEYGYLNYYSLSGSSSQVNFGNSFYNTWSPSAFAADLQWETTATQDAGLDFGFLNNRISGNVDYYYKKTSNLIANVYVPELTNFGNQLVRNVGNMTDQGAEVTLNLVPIKTHNVMWDLSFNVSYNKFVITNLSVSQDSLGKLNSSQAVGGISGGTGNTIQENAVGYAPNTFYVYQQVYGANGKPIEGLYVDQNRDGIINQEDLAPYKSPNAPFTYGFSTSFTYKKWSISTVLRAEVGNYVYNNAASNLAVTRNILNPTGFLQNGPSSVLNTNFYNNQYFSSYYVENASFLKMDNLGIGYNVGHLSRTTSLRVSLNCQNVFTVTKYTGSNPEIYGGIDNVLYPVPRTITLGGSLNF